MLYRLAHITVDCIKCCEIDGAPLALKSAGLVLSRLLFPARPPAGLPSDAVRELARVPARAKRRGSSGSTGRDPTVTGPRPGAPRRRPTSWSTRTSAPRSPPPPALPPACTHHRVQHQPPAAPSPPL